MLPILAENSHFLHNKAVLEQNDLMGGGVTADSEGAQMRDGVMTSLGIIPSY